MKYLVAFLAFLLPFKLGHAAEPFRAARSVHWGWAAPDALLFYNEIIVDESTPGSYFMACGWTTGETNRFLVRAQNNEGKTAYEGHLWMPRKSEWKHLVTFRTRTGDKPFNGFYSFVEDFRRDYGSVQETRTARFGNGWVKSKEGWWIALNRGRFTASTATWESKENIDGFVTNGWFTLRTGGDVQQSMELRSWAEVPRLQLPVAK